MKQPIKILYTIPNFITAGSGNAMLNIIQRLDRERFAPAVCVSKLGGALDEDVRGMGIPLIEADFTVPAKPYGGLFTRAKSAAKIFKPYRFDLWHSFHYAGEYTEPIIARLAGAKAWVFTKKNMSWGDRSWYLRSLLSKRIAAQNRDMLQDFFGRWPYRHKVRLIPRGVDTDSFHPNSQNVTDLRVQLTLPKDIILVGCAAHLVPVKGHPTLITAVAGFDNIHLLLAGKPIDADYSDQLHSLASELGISERVHFIGHVSDMPAFLKSVDIFVLPTWDRWRREGCPVALLEAMACGKACIATDVPGSRDLIQDGISGLLVPPEDPTALAHAIQRLADDPHLRVQLGIAARQRVEENFTIQKEVAAHEALYEEILCSKPKGERIASS